MFKETFKYYKKKIPPPSFQDVIDIERPEEFYNEIKRINTTQEHLKHQSDWLIPFEDWKIYEFIKKEGLFLISNPFTSFGQRYWIKRCLQDFPKKPNKLNIDDILDGQTWWNKCISNAETKNDLIKKLRWVTLGYHHNWETKVYNEHDCTEMPTDICNLCSIISNLIGFSNFKAQAAIINFYHEGCTLSPHTDHSEPFLNAPLLSISFGRPAIFLIGNDTLEEKPSSVFLKSGDALIMSGQSRLSYHAVPRILTNSEYKYKDLIPWKLENADQDWTPFDEYVTNSRINLNIRQMHKNC